MGNLSRSANSKLTMRRSNRQRITEEERIRRLVLQRRRNADRNARRRAEKHGVLVCDVSRDEIRRRDKETCYLCNQFVSVHEMGLDHVVPLTSGGSHTPENVRIVHRTCNSKKGARLLGEIKVSEF
jgi:5-methylcytosine-specific restriction endonuclease McrA